MVTPLQNGDNSQGSCAGAKVGLGLAASITVNDTIPKNMYIKTKGS